MRAQQKVRERIRAAYEEETRVLLTVGDLMDFVDTLHPPELRRFLANVLKRMTTRLAWSNGRWLDREEMKERHKGSGSRRMRTVSRKDSLDDISLLSAMSVRIQLTPGYERFPEVECILSLLAKHEFARRGEGATAAR